MLHQPMKKVVFGLLQLLFQLEREFIINLGIAHPQMVEIGVVLSLSRDLLMVVVQMVSTMIVLLMLVQRILF